MSTYIKLVSSTNRTAEVRRAVENFFRWVRDTRPHQASKVDVQQDPDPFILYLETPVDSGTFFVGALHVFLHAEGVEVI